MQTTKPLKILFVLIHPGYLRFYDRTIDRLIERGHEVHIAFSLTDRKPGGLEALNAIDKRVVIHNSDFASRTDPWRYFAGPMRQVLDYLRYFDPAFAEAGYLRDRTGDKLPTGFAFLTRWTSLPRPLARALRWACAGLESLIPTAANVDAQLAEIAPDMVMVSPLVVRGIGQTDVVKSARQAGIPVALGVGSWDHLTAKGMIHVRPDKVFLWNEAQKREAVALHRIPARDVVVTGAQPFDMWFDRRPILSRREFCSLLGLPEDKPFVLFAGSSHNISLPEAEVAFVERWLEALGRREVTSQSELGVLIRPHPFNFKHWEKADAPGPGVVIYPRQGANPVDEEDRWDYFHSLYYAAAVVGINTSAMIEASILNKPVLTIRVDGPGANQGETLHFRLLLPENGGLLTVARDFEEHADQLQNVLQQGDAGDESRRFAESFLRPQGRDQPAADHLVQALEGLGQSVGRRRASVPWAVRPFSWALGRWLAGRAPLLAAKAAEQDQIVVQRQRQKKKERKAAIKQAAKGGTTAKPPRSAEASGEASAPG